MHIFHTPIASAECTVMKRSSESVSVWHAVAPSLTQSISLSTIYEKEIDFICLVFFFFFFFVLYSSLAPLFLAAPESLFLSFFLSFFRFITLIATLAFRELWLRNTLSSALKHLNNPYPHVHKNQISKTLLQTKQAERARVAVYLMRCIEMGWGTGNEWEDEWIWGEMAGLCGGMQGVGACACWLQEWWKHYCVTASDPVSSKLSSGHCGNSRRGG